MKSHLVRWFPSILCAAITFYLMSFSNLFDNLPEFLYTRIIYQKASDSYLKLFEIVAVLIHFGIFIVLSTFLSWSFIGSRKEKGILPGIVLILLITFAYFGEVLQTKIPGRGFQFSDLLFDAAGSTFGIFIFIKLGKLLEGKDREPSA